MTRKVIFSKTRNLLRLPAREELELLALLKSSLLRKLGEEIPYDEEFIVKVHYEEMKSDVKEGAFYYQGSIEFEPYKPAVKHPETWREKLAAIWDVLA